MRSVVVLAVAAVLLAACGDPTQGRYGGELYSVTCAGCHGADLRGGFGPDLGAGSNAATGLTDDQIAAVIRIGPGAMPAFPRLSDAQVASLVAYLREAQGGAP